MVWSVPVLIKAVYNLPSTCRFDKLCKQERCLIVGADVFSAEIQSKLTKNVPNVGNQQDTASMCTVNSVDVVCG